MPVVTITGTAGPQWGFTAAELFVDIETTKVDIQPQFIVEKKNYQGIVDNVAYGPMEMMLAMAGTTMVKSVTAPYTGSLLLASLGVAFVPVNTYSTLVAGTPITGLWGAPTTGIYFEGGSLAYDQSQYVKFDVKFKARAGVA